MSPENENNNWMNELKEGTLRHDGKSGGGNAGNPSGYFTGVFKFAIGEKVRSRIHEANGIVEYSEMTRYIMGDQISYKIRFNDPEDFKTETSMVDEHWLEKI